jgi:hypothetical protein
MLEGLQPNLTNELGSACPYYFGSEKVMARENSSTSSSRLFNPIFDMKAD